MTPRAAASALCAVWLVLAARLDAQTPSAASAAPQAPLPPTPPAAPRTPPPSGTCVERIPQGKARPKLSEKIAERGISGHAHLLELVLEHGSGETVLPAGFQLETGSDDYKALEASRFFIPEAAGGAGPLLRRNEQAGRATTTVRLYFVPLPDKPGRQELTLPSLPIGIARASGEVMTLCTAPHRVTIEDPIANEPNPKPRPNPAPRPQLEEWTTAKHVAIAAGIALVVGALAAWLITRWMRRPKPVPAPPPPRPPWDVALESLFDLRHSGLLDEKRYAELYDRVSDVMRRYLGERYGFDGLESTTRETMTALRRAAVPMDTWIAVQQFMQDADLVKFARRAPTEEECTAALNRAEILVGSTRPVEQPALPAPAPAVDEQRGVAP